MPLEPVLYEGEVHDRVRARLDRVGAPLDDGRLLQVLERTALDDLYIAIACDHGLERAWETLIDTYAPRLDGLGRSIGARADTGSIGHDVLADLAAPPADGRRRTRIGTYDGSGGLFAWLAVILRRRAASFARLKTRPATPMEPEVLAERPAPADEGPLAQLVNAEEGTKLVHVMQAAWRTLTTRERLALHFKFGERLRLKEIGSLLGLTESGTSRLVSGALKRMRKLTKPALAGTHIENSRIQLWAALWRALDSNDDGTDAVSPRPRRRG